MLIWKTQQNELKKLLNLLELYKVVKIYRKTQTAKWEKKRSHLLLILVMNAYKLI